MHSTHNYKDFLCFRYWTRYTRGFQEPMRYPVINQPQSSPCNKYEQICDRQTSGARLVSVNLHFVILVWIYQHALGYTCVKEIILRLHFDQRTYFLGSVSTASDRLFLERSQRVVSIIHGCAQGKDLPALKRKQGRVDTLLLNRHV